MTLHPDRLRILFFSASFALVATLGGGCGSSDDGVSNDAGTNTTDSDTDPPGPILPDDTGFEGGDEGSLMLYRKRHLGGQQLTELVGLFVDEHPGFTNLAHCAVRGGPCIDVLPTTPDDYVEFQREQKFDPLFSDYRFVGLDVSLGPWSAPYINTPDLSYYYKNLTDELDGAEIRGEFGVKFGVQWGDYEGTRDIKISNDIELFNPRPGSHVRLVDNDILPIRWTPNGEGSVYLTILAGKLYSRIFLLEDDGYFELDVASLGLGADPIDDIQFSLSRWNRNTITHRGNHLDLTATSEVVWSGDFQYVGGRTKIETANKCSQAKNLPRLESGRYWGEMFKDEYNNEITMLNVPENCLNTSAAGRDAIARVVLPPDGAISVDYTLHDEVGAVYLLTECGVTSSCVAGTLDPTPGTPMFISYFNNTGAEQELFLVMDGFVSHSLQADRLRFDIDVQIDQVERPEMVDTCYDAQNMTAIQPGTYYTTDTAFDATMNPGPAAANCTGTDLFGPEAMTKVVVEAGRTLTAIVDMEAPGDPGLYLLFNCTNTTQCAAGADVDLGGEEMLIHTNPGPGSQTLYLVVDSKNGLYPYRLTIAK